MDFGWDELPGEATIGDRRNSFQSQANCLFISVQMEWQCSMSPQCQIRTDIVSFAHTAHAHIHSLALTSPWYTSYPVGYPVIDNEFSSWLTSLHKTRENCLRFNQIGIWHLTCEWFFTCLSLPWDTSLPPFVSRLSSFGIGHVFPYYVEHQPSHSTSSQSKIHSSFR